jgi:hypothetical protein
VRRGVDCCAELCACDDDELLVLGPLALGRGSAELPHRSHWGLQTNTTVPSSSLKSRVMCTRNYEVDP